LVRGRIDAYIKLGVMKRYASFFEWHEKGPKELIWLLSVKRPHEFLCDCRGDRYPLPDGERGGALGCHP
jgi:hypothetical protein